MELKAKVTSKGQLTIPKQVRQALGVREGDSLVFDVGEDDGEEVRVRVDRKPVSFADYAGILREGKGMSWEEVNAYEDYTRLFGHEPPIVRAFAILTDSDNVKTPVKADYDDFMFLIARSGASAAVPVALKGQERP